MSTITIDPILGLQQYLAADATVTSLTGAVTTPTADSPVGTNIFGIALPKSMDTVMPTYAAVLKPQAGPASPRTIQLTDSRVALWCYGPTPHLAYVLYRTIYQSLKDLTPSVWAHTYIHWCKEHAGPTPFMDTVLQWPYTISQWMLRASDLLID